MNTYRRMLADAIERNGGYSSGYRERYALAWNVKLDQGVPDFDWDPLTNRDREFKARVLERLAENFLGNTELNISDDQKAFFETEWNSESSRTNVWDMVREDMARSVTDDDTYRTWSPEVERRYGFEVDAMQRKRLKGLGLEPPNYYYFDVSWTFAGRSGGYLCLDKFESRNIAVRAEGLAEEIREDDSGTFSNEWCRKLLAMIEEWDVCFSREAVRSEFLYQCAYRAASFLSDLHAEHEAQGKEDAERLFWAERDVVTA